MATEGVRKLEKLILDKIRKLRYKPVKPGIAWAHPWSSAWFRLRSQVPREFRGGTVPTYIGTSR